MAGILTVFHACLDLKQTVLDKYHYLLYYLSVAMNPRYLYLVDNELNPVRGTVRVGLAVETVGQAGRPKTITGFQVSDGYLFLCFSCSYCFSFFFLFFHQSINRFSLLLLFLFFLSIDTHFSSAPGFQGSGGTRRQRIFRHHFCDGRSRHCGKDRRTRKRRRRRRRCQIEIIPSPATLSLLPSFLPWFLSFSFVLWIFSSSSSLFVVYPKII
jgi:hypothetical protein